MRLQTACYSCALAWLIAGLHGCGALDDGADHTEPAGITELPASEPEFDEPGACAPTYVEFVVLDENGALFVSTGKPSFEATGTVKEIGDGFPPELASNTTLAKYFSDPSSWKFMRVTQDDTSHLVMLRDFAGFGVGEGSRVRYQVTMEHVGGFSMQPLALAIHVDDQLALYAGRSLLPEQLALLDEISVRKEKALGRVDDGCTMFVVNSLHIEDRKGHEINVAPGEKRSIGEFNVCVDRAHYKPDDLAGGCATEAPADETQLRLVRRAPLSNAKGGAGRSRTTLNSK